ncbi:hypothetical protein HK097_008384 [Rhizophlyctis rosea]|uniref:Cyanocobalamin reductase (cyanide-eliminating) n=1 Tax=Rhizophlyctis rosea TaxID=64517 RepID=A0AAD5SAB7_9FUNG|nr:hypothetical protein HK097_008384 [Rhizophlyctis rosea]
MANSKHLWEPFIKYLLEDPQKRIEESEHPLNDYVKHTLTEVVAAFPNASLHYPDDKGDRFVHFQPLCHLAGLAFYNTSSYLCIHPQHGPWMAIRSCIIFDIEGPNDTPTYPILKNPFPTKDADIQAGIAKITEDALKDNEGIERGYQKRWRELLDVREMAAGFLGPEAQNAKYSPDQLHYHYTKDKTYLRTAVAKVQSQ